MPDGYVTGLGGMSYCNQTLPLPGGWGLGTRLPASQQVSCTTNQSLKVGVLWCVATRTVEVNQELRETTANLKQFVVFKDTNIPPLYQHTSPTLHTTCTCTRSLAEQRKEHCLHDNISGREAIHLKSLCPFLGYT